MELSDRIRKARKDAGYKSRDDLAEFLGSTRASIASYELGRVIPNDVFLQLMASKLNISFEWLKHGTGEMRNISSDIDDIIAQLDGDDAEIIRIYAELPPEHRKILKNFVCLIAAAIKPIDESNCQYTPEEEATYEKVKAFKEAEKKEKWLTSTNKELNVG